MMLSGHAMQCGLRCLVTRSGLTQCARYSLIAAQLWAMQSMISAWIHDSGIMYGEAGPALLPAVYLSLLLLPLPSLLAHPCRLLGLMESSGSSHSSCIAANGHLIKRGSIDRAGPGSLKYAMNGRNQVGG